VIDLDAAWGLLHEAVGPLEQRPCPIDEAAGHVLATTVTSPVDLPPFTNSAMDGYALRHSNIERATPEAPVVLQLVDETFAGDAPSKPLSDGRTVRIMTGAPVPPGADAVVRLEDALLRDGQVIVKKPLPVGANIRPSGEDVARDSVLVEAGTMLTPARTSMLTGCGIGSVEVTRKPSVAICVTGSELVEAGSPLGPGQIYDSNGHVLRSLASGDGIAVTSSRVVGDDRESIRQHIVDADQSADVIVLSGGVSVGHRDYVKRILRDLGAETIFWRVKMKPGKPLLIAAMPSGKLVVGLPGNPISCLAGWVLFVRPILRRLGGDLSELKPEATPAQLAETVRGDAGRVRMVTGSVQVNSHGVVMFTPTGMQGSAMLRSMAAGNCFAQVDVDANLRAGDLVDTYPYFGTGL
jgi:molybdopterin molybdotransferase